MPKITVYIPDDLLERARKLPDGGKTSQIVQRGLNRLLDEAARDDPPMYATRPEGAEERILGLREKFLEEAEREYATGYSAAVDVAEALPLWTLNDLARRQFEIRGWLKAYAAAAHDELLERGKGKEITHEEVAAMPEAEVAELLANTGRLPQPKPEESQWWWVWRLAKTLGFVANPLDFDEGAFDPTNARVLGFTDALRDLWEAIEAPYESRIDRAAKFERHLRSGAGDQEAGVADMMKTLRERHTGGSARKSEGGASS